MTETVRFALPLLAAGQAQKEVTHNEAVLALDRLLHVAVIARDVAGPPAAPLPGDTYIVPSGATGSWAGQTDLIASHDGFHWAFAVPRPGMMAFVAAEQACVVFDDGWGRLWPVAGLSVGGRAVLAAAPASIADPVGGAVVDLESRSAINALIVALRAQGLIV